MVNGIKKEIMYYLFTQEFAKDYTLNNFEFMSECNE